MITEQTTSMRLLVALCAICAFSAADATTFTVTSVADGAGTCPDVANCTLWQAITNSNSAGGSNTIDFNIGGAGAHTITLTGQLPGISNDLLINGSTQSGWVPNANAPDAGGLSTQLTIQIDGAGQSYGFYVSGNHAVAIEHLAMNGFTGNAIAGDTSQPGTLAVRGCFIGTQLDGSAFPSGYGNNGTAIHTGAGLAHIGGALTGERNLISGNRGGGIYVAGPAVIEGNLIGTDAGGTQAIGNGLSSNWPGIVLPGNFPNIRVGCGSNGSGPGCGSTTSRNVISGNHTYGIAIWDSFGQGTGGLEIKGNFIGTDWTGTKALPNGDGTAGCPTYCGGIQLQGSSTATPASLIGGFATGEANLIAFNLGYGIAGFGNAIGASFDNHGNAIHNNGGSDLVFNLNDGRSANDAGDADAGTNNKQNYPKIDSASVSGTPGNLVLNVTYEVDSAAANSSYGANGLRVDFYVDVDEGSGDFLVTDNYPVGLAMMPRSIALPLPASVQSLAGFVASATDANGYSSELSPSRVFDRIFADRFELKN
jgi:hypothetical protein